MKKLKVEYMPHCQGKLKYAKPGDSGLDLASADNHVFIDDVYWLVRTGIKLEIEGGYDVQVRPRSSLFKKYGLIIPNSPGTIDSGYRGEIFVPVLCLDLLRYAKSGGLRRGHRFAQLVVTPVLTPKIVQVSHVEDSERGEGGFGSTGD